ncbi:MAG: acetyl-CoA carboxylase biotin carboxylase subunit, partial [Methanoregulaceae archaeon]|nr:acetyl-CoA carboxylase biotin carboxylase subunit [Methanoregulaceae archaeon]
ARMRRAIYEYVIIGVKTTLPLHHAIMHNRHFIAGDTHTHFLQEEHIIKTLTRYVREEETRIQTLAASLRQGKEIAAITGALDVYMKGQKKAQ